MEALDRKKLVIETLETATDYSGKTARFIGSLAVKVQAGSLPDQSEWDDLFSALEWLAEACSALAAEDSLLLEAAPLKKFVTELSPVLQELSQAMGKKDYVFLGDLLEYELAEKTAELHEAFLSCFRDRAKGEGKV